MEYILLFFSWYLLLLYFSPFCDKLVHKYVINSDNAKPKAKYSTDSE